MSKEASEKEKPSQGDQDRFWNFIQKNIIDFNRLLTNTEKVQFKLKFAVDYNKVWSETKLDLSVCSICNKTFGFHYRIECPK